jgi:hypothetical protein
MAAAIGVALFLAGLCLLSLPMILGHVGKTRLGVWVGIAQLLLTLLPVPYGIIVWLWQCTTPQVAFVGEMAIDNDAVCRSLFFGAPGFALFAAVGLVFFLPQVLLLHRELSRIPASS